MQKLLVILGIVSLIIGSLFSNVAWAEQEIPRLTQRVTDTAGLLNIEQSAHLEQIVRDLEKTEGSQVAILIVTTTSPENISEFSIRAAEKWKLGRKDVDDGVLLVVATKDKKIRIEVGYGLEGAITDLSAGRIIREYITPEFRRARFYEGILAGTSKIISLIKGEALPAPTTSQGNSSTSFDPGILVFIMVAASQFLGKLVTPLLGRILTVSLFTSVGAAVTWFVSQSLLMAAVTALFIGMFTLASTGSRSNSYRDGDGHGGGFGGGGSSGGGFSGGGGSFGGGGASGGW